MIEYDYFGPTRIVGVEIESDDFRYSCDGDVRQPSCTYYPGFRANYLVEFGRDWACPNRQASAPNWCQTKAEKQDCTIQFICMSEQCSDEEREKDRGRVSNCLREDYPQISNIDNGTTPQLMNFSKDIPPWEDPDWPSIPLYVDCDTCTAIEAPAPGDINDLHRNGLITASAGTVLVAASLVYSILFVRCDRGNGSYERRD